MGTDRPFVVNPELTGIALAYTNTDYIADKVLPRVPVAKECFAYNEYANGAFLNAPDARIGRKGIPETLEVKSARKTAECQAYSIKAEVPQSDVEEAAASDDATLDPKGDNTLLVTEALKLSREKRVAELVTNKSTYGGNFVELDKDTSFASKSSSVIDVFKDVKNNMLMEPTHAVISSASALYLQTHPDFLSVYKAENANNKGLVPLDFIAKALGLKEILVGKAKVNAGKQGKSQTIQSVWGEDMLFFYQNPLAKPTYGLTFGLTAERGKMTVMEYFDPERGSKGVNIIKPVENLKELILSKGCGYLVKDAFIKG